MIRSKWPEKVKVVAGSEFDHQTSREIFPLMGWCQKLKLAEVTVKPNSLFLCSSSNFFIPPAQSQPSHVSLRFLQRRGQTPRDTGHDTSLLMTVITIFIYYCCHEPDCWQQFYLKRNRFQIPELCTFSAPFIVWFMFSFFFFFLYLTGQMWCLLQIMCSSSDKVSATKYFALSHFL